MDCVSNCVMRVQLFSLVGFLLCNGISSTGNYWRDSHNVLCNQWGVPVPRVPLELMTQYKSVDPNPA